MNMKRLFLFRWFFVVLVAVLLFQGRVFSADLQVTGAYVLLENVASKHLADRRNVLVLLPRGYFDPASREKRYPVLYMHDGNNLFDPRLSFTGIDWGVDEATDSLVKHRLIEPIIVVGIYNSPARMEEYTPFVDPKHGGGKGENYATFLIEELKPRIDREFRTLADRGHTGIGGSSLGGLISLYIGLSRPEVFSQIIAMSSSVWFADSELSRWIRGRKIPDDMKIWTDMGLNEDPAGGETVETARAFDAAFRQAFPRVKGYRYKEIPGAVHSESAWRRRFPEVLRFQYPTP